MTSDELFWRLVLASRTIDEAALLWWLAAVRADEFSYRSSSREISRCLGNIGQKAILRAAESLVSQGLVELKVVKNVRIELRLLVDRVDNHLGQIVSLQTKSAARQFDPCRHGLIDDLLSSTACSRLCMLQGNREEAILLAWLHHAGAATDPVRVSSRDMEAWLCNLVDRRTAMRAMARLQAVGLVAVAPMGHVGTEYRLNGGALQALLATFPFDEAAAATMPGWANLTFPLLQRLSLASSVGAAPTAQVADMEV